MIANGWQVLKSGLRCYHILLKEKDIKTESPLVDPCANRDFNII